MALINLQETDSAATCGIAVYCSGGTSQASSPKLAQSGGSAGSTPVTISINGSTSLRIVFGFDCPIAAGATWDAGTWTVRWNVTTANMNLTWEEVHICRLSSSCVNQATIGSATALGISLGATGVKTQTVSGAAQSPSVGDRVYILFVITNAAMTLQSFDITPSEIINTPFDDGGGPSTFLKDVIMYGGMIPVAR